MSRPRAEMMPAVAVPPRPNGLPIATTQSPTRALSESPNATYGKPLASTLISARSVFGSLPTSVASNLRPSCSVTVISSAPPAT